MTMLNDIGLSEQVQNTIKSNPTLNESRIIVDADEGVVTLSGSVKDYEQHETTIESVRKMQEVERVIDELRLDDLQPGTIVEFLDDLIITATIKQKIMREKGLGFFSIGVKTRDGIVTLTGEAKAQENLDAATKLAAETSTVKRVINKMITLHSSSFPRA